MRLGRQLETWESESHVVGGNLKVTACMAHRGWDNGGQGPHPQTVGLRAERLAPGLEDYCYSYFGMMSNPERMSTWDSVGMHPALLSQCR